MTKARSFCFTDFSRQAAEIFTIVGDKAKFCIVGNEVCPDTGRDHRQCYVQWKNPRSLKAVIKLLTPAHVEIAQGSPKQNMEYCKKEGDFVTIGAEPVGEGSRTDLEEIKEAIDTGATAADIANSHFGTWTRNHRAIDRYIEMRSKPYEGPREIIVLYGDSGTGKSREAYERGAAFIEYQNGFIQGYKGEKIVCFDDVATESFPGRLFLRLTDRYPMVVNVKGGEVPWNAEIIIFTSNVHPSSWWEPRGIPNERAVQRRITECRHFGTEQR